MSFTRAMELGSEQKASPNVMPTGPTMRTTVVDDAHLRDLANRCLLLSNNCYDLTAAAQLRVIASEIKVEAAGSETDVKPAPIHH